MKNIMNPIMSFCVIASITIIFNTWTMVLESFKVIRIPQEWNFPLSHESLSSSILHKSLYPEPTFLHSNELEELDIFAASWWMHQERFRNVPLHLIGNVEGDVFVPILRTGKGRYDVRMATDWYDFALEHLSKWQKLIGTTDQGNAYAEQKCYDYVSKYQDNNAYQIFDTYMNTTIAVIPYGVNDDAEESTQKVWTAYLAATITSLIQHSMKRIVVVGYYDMDAQLAANAFGILLKENMVNRNLAGQEFQLGMIELTYIRMTEVKTKFTPNNVPYGALKGLQDALQKGPPMMKNVTGSFLRPGRTAADYSYVYLTEADQILHARLSSSFWEHLNNHRVIVPHRLQPIPHNDDIGTEFTQTSELQSLPINHAPVIYVTDSTTSDACCDDPTQYGEKTCDSFWWMCGYGPSHGNFTHLEPFDFMKLDRGMNIVTLGGNEHGRRCRVERGGRGTCPSQYNKN